MEVNVQRGFTDISYFLVLNMVSFNIHIWLNVSKQAYKRKWIVIQVLTEYLEVLHCSRVLKWSQVTKLVKWYDIRNTEIWNTKKDGIVSCSERGQPTLYHQLWVVSSVTWHQSLEIGSTFMQGFPTIILYTFPVASPSPHTKGLNRYYLNNDRRGLVINFSFGIIGFKSWSQHRLRFCL